MRPALFRSTTSVLRLSMSTSTAPPFRAPEIQAIAQNTTRPSVTQDQEAQAPSEALQDPVEQAKRLAAYAAVDRHVLPGMQIVGIGSGESLFLCCYSIQGKARASEIGSTVPYVVERIVQQGKQANAERCVRSLRLPLPFLLSAQMVRPDGVSVEGAHRAGASPRLIFEGRTRAYAQAGLRLGDVDAYPVIDVTIDGADEVDDELSAYLLTLYLPFPTLIVRTDCIKGGGGCHLREKLRFE